MALDIRIISLQDFVRSDVHGELDLATSIRDLTEIAKACIEQDNHHVLIDARQACGNKLSAVDIWTIASSLEKVGFGRMTRIAVLNAPRDDFDRAAFLETCTLNRGFNLRAFRDFEQAVLWLASNEPQP